MLLTCTCSAGSPSGLNPIITALGTCLAVVLPILAAAFIANMQIAKNRRVKWLNDLRDKYSQLGSAMFIIGAHKENYIQDFHNIASRILEIYYLLSPSVQKQAELRRELRGILSDMADAYLANNDYKSGEEFFRIGELLDRVISSEERRIRKFWQS